MSTIQTADPVRFSGRELSRMVIPLFLEQLLVMLVGLADTFVISYCGEAGVAYPSLIARTVSAVWITALCFSRKKSVHYRMEWILHWNPGCFAKFWALPFPMAWTTACFSWSK